MFWSSFGNIQKRALNIAFNCFYVCYSVFGSLVVTTVRCTTAKTANSKKAIYLLLFMSYSIIKQKFHVIDKWKLIFQFYLEKKFAPKNGGGRADECLRSCSIKKIIDLWAYCHICLTFLRDFCINKLQHSWVINYQPSYLTNVKTAIHKIA